MPRRTTKTVKAAEEKPSSKTKSKVKESPPDLTPAAELLSGTAEAPEPKKGVDPIKFEQSMLNIHISQLGDELYICRLKDEAPPEVVMKSGYYIDGFRIFSKQAQPFRVTKTEFETILDRGRRHFEKLDLKKEKGVTNANGSH